MSFGTDPPVEEQSCGNEQRTREHAKRQRLTEWLVPHDQIKRDRDSHNGDALAGEPPPSIRGQGHAAKSRSDNFPDTQGIGADHQAAEIQAHLGHSSTATTLDVYGHLLPQRAESVADTLEDIWREAN